MRRLAWTFAARIGYKYQIRLSRPIYCPISKNVLLHNFRQIQGFIINCWSTGRKLDPNSFKYCYSIVWVTLPPLVWLQTFLCSTLVFPGKTTCFWKPVLNGCLSFIEWTFTLQNSFLKQCQCVCQDKWTTNKMIFYFFCLILTSFQDDCND